mmetsp:Transcript_15793/g.48275  ORF Transcript_15793/g.48275 Transcript_15793/m.48275 type:complete len:270 (-) Transcript_15793:790-1599(-)
MLALRRLDAACRRVARDAQVGEHEGDKVVHFHAQARGVGHTHGEEQFVVRGALAHVEDARGVECSCRPLRQRAVPRVARRLAPLLAVRVAPGRLLGVVGRIRAAEVPVAVVEGPHVGGDIVGLVKGESLWVGAIGWATRSAVRGAVCNALPVHDVGDEFLEAAPEVVLVQGAPCMHAHPRLGAPADGVEGALQAPGRRVPVLHKTVFRVHHGRRGGGRGWRGRGLSGGHAPAGEDAARRVPVHAREGRLVLRRIHAGEGFPIPVYARFG